MTSIHKYRSATFILSGAYCDPELQAEFGAKIPSCMVPIGPKTLLHKQVEEAFKDETTEIVIVALPEDYQITVAVAPTRGTVVHMKVKTSSMDHTFHLMLQRFQEWLRSEREDVFQQNVWHINVLNGDTLMVDVEDKSEHTVVARYAPENTSFHWHRSEKGMVYTGSLRFVYDVNSEEDYSFGKLLFSATPQVVDSGHWFDFGHLHTYYRSKREHMTSRAFNKVSYKASGSIIKTGELDKVHAEFRWFHAIGELPGPLPMYLPRVGVQDFNSYQMEYLPMLTLAELFVYGQHDVHFWSHIAKKLRTLLSDLRKAADPEERVTDGLLLAKSKKRVSMLNEKLCRKAMTIIEALEPWTNKAVGVVHGDLCFSNILYDHRSDTLKVIDPRGLDSEGKNTIYGSQIYDLAKLFHSGWGLYDHAIANKETYQQDVTNGAAIREMVFSYAKQIHVPTWAIEGATALLFYSMLPLHAEDVQRVNRLVSKADWLYDLFKEHYDADQR